MPESYVQSTVTASVAERLGAISQQILSRTRLERLIEEFNLYPEERKTMIMEDIVDLMRERDINLAVESPRRRRNDDASHFSVSYESPQPAHRPCKSPIVWRACSCNENMQDRASLADSTSQFLQSQLEDAKRRLQESEKRVETFKLLNTGQLPDQQQTNMQMLQVTQTQIQSNEDAIARERDQLSVLESVISESTAGVDQPLGGGVVETRSVWRQQEQSRHGGAAAVREESRIARARGAISARSPGRQTDEARGRGTRATCCGRSHQGGGRGGHRRPSPASRARQ